MGTAAFDRARLAERAEQGWITVTELADTLTRDHDVPFKTGHTIATRLIKEVADRPSDPRSRVLHDVSLSVLGRAIDYDEPALDELLSARHFVETRKTLGGPASSETTRALAASRALLADRRSSGWRMRRIGFSALTLFLLTLHVLSEPGRPDHVEPSRTPSNPHQSVSTQCFPSWSGSSRSSAIDEPGTVAVQEVDQGQRAFLRLPEREYLRLRPRELAAQGLVAALRRLDHLARGATASRAPSLPSSSCRARSVGSSAGIASITAGVRDRMASSASFSDCSTSGGSCACRSRLSADSSRLRSSSSGSWCRVRKRAAAAVDDRRARARDT